MKSQVDQARILDKFLVDNADLEELSARLSVFNIFGTLRIEKTEIRHSNVLAWLLDPRGSHGTVKGSSLRLTFVWYVDGHDERSCHFFRGDMIPTIQRGPQTLHTKNNMTMFIDSFL